MPPPSPTETVPLMEPSSPSSSALATAPVRSPLWLARLALPLLLPVVAVLLWAGSDSLTMPRTTTATAAAAPRGTWSNGRSCVHGSVPSGWDGSPPCIRNHSTTGGGAAALESLPQPPQPPQSEQEASAALTEWQRQRLLEGMAAIEAALAADDKRRARRAAKGGGGGEGAGEEKDDLGSYYDAAAAVPVGVIYPEGQWLWACLI